MAPLLLAQGLHVRHKTPRLPEPPGERRGSNGVGPPLRLLIAGDSAAAGVGADMQASALSGRLAANLARDFRISWQLVATTGNTIADAIAQLEAESPDAFDVAVVSVGVNDVTGGTTLHRWLELQGRLVGLLKSRFEVQRVLWAAIPPMQAFPALPNPLAWYFGKRAAHLNRLSIDRAGQGAGFEFVQPAFPFEASLIAADGFHPGPAAYVRWAAQLADIIRHKPLL